MTLFSRLRRVIRWCVLLAFPPVLFYACTLYYVYDHMRGNSELPADCAIVFGTAIWPVYSQDGRITSYVAGPGITRRVTTAVELLKQGNVKKLFLSGGKGEGSQKSEAQVMRSVALSLGADARVITVEDSSRSTWENLVNTRPLL